MDETQKRYFANVRIEELQRCIDSILGNPKRTSQDQAVLKDARIIYKARMGKDYR